MVKYKNITIIATSHIAKESIDQVKNEIKKIKPDIIAIELDHTRLKALLSKKKKITSSIYKLGFRGFIFNLIGASIEKHLSKHTGILPGSEMKTAIKLAQKYNIKLALIDQPINITINNLVSQITPIEKLRFIKEFFHALILKKSRLDFDLNSVPSKKTIEKIIKETMKKYPTLFKVLIKERDIHMGKALYKLMLSFPDKKILAIVGAGHEMGILGELKSKKN